MKRVSYRFCTGRTKSITRSFFTYVLGVFPQTFLNSADLLHQNDFSGLSMSSTPMTAPSFTIGTTISELEALSQAM